MLLYLDDTAKCISKAMCMFGKPNGVVRQIYSYCRGGDSGGFSFTDEYICLSRQDRLDKYPWYYISITLFAENSMSCYDPAVADNHICACPGETYFNGVDYFSSPKRTECPYLPEIFDKSHLKLDVQYMYDGQEHVQHHGLVTYEECTSKYINRL